MIKFWYLGRLIYGKRAALRQVLLLKHGSKLKQKIIYSRINTCMFQYQQIALGALSKLFKQGAIIIIIVGGGAKFNQGVSPINE